MRTVLGTLLWAKIRSPVNALRRRGGTPWRGAALALLGGGFWAGVFGACLWFFGQVQSVEVFGDVLLEQLLAMVLLVIFAVLLFSNLVAAFSAYFLADDLAFLMARPVPPYSFFAARFAELSVQSSWMALLFSLAVFLALGTVYEASPVYYLRLAGVLVPLVVICSAAASIVALVLTTALPARRTREVLVLLVALAFVLLFVLFRALQPERFLNPDERAGIVELLATLSGPRLTMLPPEWMHRVLWPGVIGDDRSVVVDLMALWSSGAGLYVVASWLFRAVHLRAYTRAYEGRPEGSAPERALRRLLFRRTTAAERGLQALSRLAGRRGRLGFVEETRRKDGLTFIRDTGQWTQMVLLGAIIAIYLLNFRYIRGIGEGGIIGLAGLYYGNLALGSFVITALCVRFVFPLVSLEGRSFWMIRTAPVTARRFLLAKWWTAALPITLFGELLVTLSNLSIGVERLHVLAGAVLVLPMALGVTGLGVGLGALYPRFDSTNPATIATGFGGFFYMVAGVVASLVVVGLSAYPVHLLQRLWHGRELGTHGSPALAVGLALLALILLPLLGWLAMGLGARRLERSAR